MHRWLSQWYQVMHISTVQEISYQCIPTENSFASRVQRLMTHLRLSDRLCVVHLNLSLPTQNMCGPLIGHNLSSKMETWETIIHPHRSKGYKNQLEF